MKAQCHLAYGDDAIPDEYIRLSRKKLHTYERLPVLNIKVTTSTRHHDSFSETLGGIARNQVLDLTDFVSGLVVVGGRNSILELFSSANLSPVIKVCTPMYIAINRKKRTLKDDLMVVKISAERTNKLNPQKFNNNGGRQLHWSYFNVTDQLQLRASGREYEVHPMQFVAPLKNMFDEKKWS